MFYDLNVPWSASDSQLPRTLAFLHELGYNVVALNHVISGKLPSPITCAIPDPLPASQSPLPARLTVLRRATLVLTDAAAPPANARLAELARAYDVVALRPVDERTLQLACASLACDLISVDLARRLPFLFRFRAVREALRAGKRFEICYGAAGLAGAADARRHLIANAGQLIRASRGGRGLVLSSEARAALACRGPWDVVNLATVWGLGQERAYEAVSKEARGVVVRARLKRTSYRGVVDVLHGGERPEADGRVDKAAASNWSGRKRKADAMAGPGQDSGAAATTTAEEQKPLSKTQQKKRARLEAGKKREEAAAAAAAAATEVIANASAST